MELLPLKSQISWLDFHKEYSRTIFDQYLPPDYCEDFQYKRCFSDSPDIVPSSNISPGHVGLPGPYDQLFSAGFDKPHMKWVR